VPDRAINRRFVRRVTPASEENGGDRTLPPGRYDDLVRMPSNWLDRQPPWLYVPITFVIYSLIWAFVAYADAWMSAPHHPIPGDAGFPDGHLSVPEILMMAAITTVIVTVGQLWRRRRRARQGSGA
jgi:hypothetical protein